jgi:hypothetical protein
LGPPALKSFHEKAGECQVFLLFFPLLCGTDGKVNMGGLVCGAVTTMSRLVARKLVAYVMAVDRRQRNFQVVETVAASLHRAWR